MTLTDVNDAYICPITGGVFTDPVQDPEGNTYERVAILNWLLNNPTSPVTRTPLSASQLVPNRSLLDAISSMNLEEGTPASPVPVLPPAAPRAIAAHALPVLATAVTPSSATLAFIHPAFPSATSFTISPPSSTATTRTPSHVVLVIDISGSMAGSATTKDATEDSGLSILDITKHAAKTIVSLLSPADKLTLVTFHDQAATLISAVAMTPANRTAAITKIMSLSAQRSTNLWDGLLSAMNAVKDENLPNGLSSIFLLTDGVPNVEPPRGHIPMLKMFQDENPTLTFTVNTFGFGYNLDSSLLVDIAKATGGNFSFIPDASFVGTVFVHAISNTLAQHGQTATLSVEIDEATDCVVVGADYQRTTWGVVINVGDLAFDQKRTFVVLTKKPLSSAYAKLSYHDVSAGNVTIESASAVQGAADDLELLRLASVDAMTAATAPNNTGGDIAACVAAIKAVNMPALAPLLTDMQGQVTQAVETTAYYQRWGRHYLPAMARAHLLNVCTNFKDPGMQSYGGAAFDALRNAGDKIFMSMPPPTPSRTVHDSSGRRCSAQVMSSAAYSRSYYNSSNSCFAGDCVVSMRDGRYKLVGHVKKGDNVLGGVVEAVVKTLTEGGKCDLVVLDNGLKSTPYHPIMWEGAWTFPKDIKAISKGASCHAVYSFVLEKGAGGARGGRMVINDVEVVTLAHGIVGDAVASHAYFGTENVVEDLKKFGGSYAKGVVVLNYGAMRREKAGNPGFDSEVFGIYEERVAVN